MTIALAPGRPPVAAWLGRFRVDDLGFLLGLVLPATAAALYRTYSIAVTPAGLEQSRQFGLPFVLAEVAIILYANRRGLEPGALIAGLDRWSRRALLLFLATFWIGAVFVSQRPAMSILWTVIWLVHLVFGAATYYLARLDRRFEPDRFAMGFALGSLLLAVWTAFHFAFPPPGLYVPHGAYGWGGAVPGFISHRLFGAWCGAVAALLLALAWIGRAGARTRWLYPAIALAAGLAIWTGTRAAVLGVVVGMAAVPLLAGRPAHRSFWWKAPSAIAVAALIGTLLNPYGDPFFMLVRTSDTGTVNELSSGRLGYWADALAVAWRTPWLGAGAGATGWLVPAGDMYHVQPHNALVQFLLDWGLLPTTAALTMLGAATWHAHRRARTFRRIVPLVAMLDCLLAMSLVDGMLHFPRFVMLTIALLAICLAYQKEGEGEPVTCARAQ